ncbi:MAG: non-canonical purine NTP pyrophosphatase [Vulcanimicrobiaceae bacterium]
MKTFVATKNLGKLDEMRAIFAGSPLELDTYPLYADIVEGEHSYRENASLKARALHRQLNGAGVRGAVLADDSGLEVEALGGRPGVLSARYAGKDATWPQRRELLLDELRDVPEERRGARFVCAMTLILEDGTELESFADVCGSIADSVHGRFGFGYDPVFFYPPAAKTFAELAEEEKNRVSHRRRAADALLAQLTHRV